MFVARSKTCKGLSISPEEKKKKKKKLNCLVQPLDQV